MLLRNRIEKGATQPEECVGSEGVRGVDNLQELEVVNVLVVLVGVKLDLLDVDRAREKLVHELAVRRSRAEILHLPTRERHCRRVVEWM